MIRLSEKAQAKIARAAGMVIAHPHYRRALTLATECVERGDFRKPPPGLLITGPSGSGKTTLAKSLEAAYPSTESTEASLLPVLIVETPAQPTIKSLAEAILLALGVQVPGRTTAAQLTRLIVRWVKARGVRVIVIDEIQHFAERHHEQVRVAADYFKTLINSMELPIILLGLESSQALLDANEQLSRRFTSRVELPRFLYERDEQQITFRNFLRAVQNGSGLEFAMELWEASIAQQMHWASAGLPAHVLNIVLGAAEAVLRQQKTVITVEDLGRSFIDYVWDDGLGTRNPFSSKFVGRDLMLPGEPFHQLSQTAKVGRPS